MKLYRIHRILLLSLACLLQTVLAENNGPKTLAELQAAIERVLRETNTPGACVAIVRKDGPEWIAGLGLADVAANKPVTPDTLFRVCSISKGFVSLSLLKLEQEGRLTLQDTLKSRAPALLFDNPWEDTEPVRLIHLLEHTAGWDDLSLREYAFEHAEKFSLKDGLDFNPGARRSRWRPGSGYSYANAGPVAAAYVVEQLTGQKFEDHVEQTWFKPLGMTTASYLLTPALESRMTKLYLADGRTPAPYWHLTVRAAGSLNASAKEMANYLQFLLNRGSFGGVQLLPPEAITRMETPSSNLAARQGMKLGYGLSNQTLQSDGRVFHGHYGSLVHGMSELVYSPEEGVGFIFMTNSGSGAAFGGIDWLLRSYITQKMPRAPEAPAIASVRPSVLQEYAGWYEPTCPPTQVITGLWRLLLLTEIRPQANGLGLRRFQGPFRDFMPYLAVSERLYRRPNEALASLALIEDRSDGTRVQVDMYDHVHTFRRIPASVAWLQILSFGATVVLLLNSLALPLIWATGMIFQRKMPSVNMGVRVLPVLAALSLVGAIWIFQSAQANAIRRFGELTPWSLGFFVMTLAFALFALWGLVSALRTSNRMPRRWFWWHAFASSLVFSLVALYLGYWGYVGFRSWV